MAKSMLVTGSSTRRPNSSPTWCCNQAKGGSAGFMPGAGPPPTSWPQRKLSSQHTAWVYTRDEVIASGMFGPTVPPPVAARLGDVAVLARDNVSYHDPDDTGPFALMCRHGSLTSAEVNVPLLAALPRP